MSREQLSLAELLKLDECPCDMCSSQGDENDPLERQKLDEICDVYSNYLIDYILENHKKDILKRTNKEDTVK